MHARAISCSVPLVRGTPKAPWTKGEEAGVTTNKYEQTHGIQTASEEIGQTENTYIYTYYNIKKTS